MKRWIYSATEEPKIIDNKEYDKYEKEGWLDTPASFIKLTDVGVDPDDSFAVQTFGESVEGVVESLNGQLNLEKMTKIKLAEYASDHYGCELDLKLKKKVLRGQVEVLVSNK